MIFPEYLIKHNIITHENFNAIIARQLESMPSILSVIIQLNILSPEMVSKVLFEQIEKGDGLIDIVRRNNLLTDEQFKVVYSKYEESAPSFIDILIEVSGIGRDKIKEAYDRFLEENEKQEVVKEENKSKSEGEETPAISQAALESLKEIGGINEVELAGLEKSASPEKEAEEIAPEGAGDVEMSQAALESLKELGMDLPSTNSGGASAEAVNGLELPRIENSFVDEFLNVFSEKTYNKLKKIVDILNKTAESDGEISNFLNSLYRDLHLLKGASSLAEITHLAQLLTETENVVEKLFDKDNSFLKGWVENNNSLLSDVFDFIWEIRKNIESTQVEFIEGQDVRFKDLKEKVSGLFSAI